MDPGRCPGLSHLAPLGPSKVRLVDCMPYRYAVIVRVVAATIVRTVAAMAVRVVGRCPVCFVGTMNHPLKAPKGRHVIAQGNALGKVP